MCQRMSVCCNVFCCGDKMKFLTDQPRLLCLLRQWRLRSLPLNVAANPDCEHQTIKCVAMFCPHGSHAFLFAGVPLSPTNEQRMSSIVLSHTKPAEGLPCTIRPIKTAEPEKMRISGTTFSKRVLLQDSWAMTTRMGRDGTAKKKCPSGCARADVDVLQIGVLIDISDG